jgi:hypothetical protein
MDKLYRFSPIKTEEELIKAIKHIHFGCFALCKNSLGFYLPVPGNMGVFCHYEDEYERLLKFQKELTNLPENPSQKYFSLKKPIVIPAGGDVPETVYTHLYIRKPDPYRHHVGDMDFIMSPKDYKEFKEKAIEGKIKGARSAIHPTHDMVELFDPDSDVLGYISDHHLL